MAKLVRVDDQDWGELRKIRFEERQEYLKDVVHFLIEEHRRTHPLSNELKNGGTEKLLEKARRGPPEGKPTTASHPEVPA